MTSFLSQSQIEFEKWSTFHCKVLKESENLRIYNYKTQQPHNLYDGD